MSKRKDKILFWLESYYLHFGISKALIEKYDCDPYALIACSPKQKSFFDNQKLVKFKKIWHVRDYVNLNNLNYDFAKLKHFENKFSISLQKIVYADRLFYKYNEFHSFTDDEIFSIIQQELEFYDNVLDEISPDYVVMRIPDHHDIDLFYEICKAKKITVLLLSPMRMGDRYRVSSNPEAPILFDKHKDIEIKSFDTLIKHVESFSKAHKSAIQKIQSKNSQKFSALILIFSTFRSSNINSFRDVGKTPWTTLTKGISLLLLRSYRKSFLDKNAKTSLPMDHPYVYFPLHMEPERTLSKKGQFYSDQIPVIKNIVQSLPVEMNLLVKEHPSMRLVGWRPLKFYKEILNLPKVTLIHPSVSSKTIIQNSTLIATIAGTTALEAAFYEKPSIVFSDIDCSSLSCVFKVNNLEELPAIIKKSLDSQVDLVELNHYVHEVLNSSFTCNIFDLNFLSANLFGAGGFINLNYISESKMKDFLEENKASFDLLANEHIKKIELTKQKNSNDM